jgi:hypothetical protein
VDEDERRAAAGGLVADLAAVDGDPRHAAKLRGRGDIISAYIQRKFIRYDALAAKAGAHAVHDRQRRPTAHITYKK